MGFIEHELKPISVAPHEPRFANQYDRLNAAQQAWPWDLEPTEFNAPYDMLMGTPADSEDYLADPHPLRS